MHAPIETVIAAIDKSPYNTGIDGKAWVASVDHVPVLFDGGDVALFEHHGDGVFEAHFMFNSRGRKAIERVREAFRTMFDKNGATTIFGLIHDPNRKMKLVARWAGAKSHGKRWIPIPGKPRGETVELFTVTRGAI